MSDGVPLGDALGLVVGVKSPVPLGVCEIETELVGVGKGELAAVAHADKDDVGEGVVVIEGEAVRVEGADEEGDAVPEDVGVGVRVALGVSDPDPVCEDVGVEEELTSVVPEGVVVLESVVEGVDVPVDDTDGRGEPITAATDEEGEADGD